METGFLSTSSGRRLVGEDADLCVQLVCEKTVCIMTFYKVKLHHVHALRKESIYFRLKFSGIFIPYPRIFGSDYLGCL